MNRNELLQALLAERDLPIRPPWMPYDSPSDQEARRAALREDVRRFDRYRPARPKPVPVPARPPRCANCGSHRIERPRPVVAA